MCTALHFSDAMSDVLFSPEDALRCEIRIVIHQNESWNKEKKSNVHLIIIIVRHLSVWLLEVLKMNLLGVPKSAGNDTIVSRLVSQNFETEINYLAHTRKYFAHAWKCIRMINVKKPSYLFSQNFRWKY